MNQANPAMAPITRRTNISFASPIATAKMTGAEETAAIAPSITRKPMMRYCMPGYFGFAELLDGYPQQAIADPTKPYVMWPGTSGTPYEHLMMPAQ